MKPHYSITPLLHRFVLFLLLVTGHWSLVTPLFADVSAVRYDMTTGVLILDPDGVQYLDVSPAQLKINGTQLVATGKTVSFANSVAFNGTDGKTLSLNQNLTFTGTSGKVLTLTGSFTAGADTTITGGGTIALGGFTFTVPATGTGVLTSRTITEGNGLAGNTYDLSANRTLVLGTPSTNGVSSTNAVTATSHTHAITSSSNPGAAASILATNSSGYLQLVRLGIGVAPTQPLHVAGNAFIDAATANLYMKDTSTGLQVSSTGIINPQSGNAFRTTSFTSGVNGWNVSNDGSAEFNNVRVRGELAASVFKVSEISATAGTFGVFYSAAALNADCTTPGSTSSSFTFDAKNSDAGGMLFTVNDVVRFKSWTGAAISDSWATITARTTHTTYTTYTATLNSGSTSATFRAGTAVIDYGPSGTGFITLSTDGTVGSSPNMTMATHAGSPWSAFTPQLRLGNLNGSYGYATDIYGLGAGQYGAASKSWFTIDQTNGLRIGNNTTTLGQWKVSGEVAIGTESLSTSYIYFDGTNGMRFLNGATARMRLALDGSGFLANTHIAWDTSGNLTIDGNATIAGWTVNSTYFAKDTGTDSTSAGMAPVDYPFFAGSTYANRATAPFRVTPAGALTATSATITGAITASSGSITGPLTLSGASGSISLGTTPPTSATVGTGIWLDRTGLYSLSSSTQNIVLDSTGVTAGSVHMDSTGLTITAPSSFAAASAVTWKSSGTVVGGLYNYATGTSLGITKVEAVSTTAAVRLQLQSDSVSRDVRIFAGDGLGVGSANVLSGVVIGRSTSSAHMLAVYGTGWFQSDLTVGDGGTGTTLRQLILNGGSGTGGGPQISFQSNSVTGCAIGTEQAIAGGSASTTKATLYSSNSTYRLYGLGAGTLSTDASGNVTSTSDERRKNIDGLFTRGLADIRGLKPKIGHWKPETGFDTTEQYVWLTAQDLLPTIPEAVHLGPDGFYTVDQSPVLDALINAVNEVDARLAKLEGANAPEPDSLDRKKLAADRLAGLKTRMLARQAAEAAARHKAESPPPLPPSPPPIAAPSPKPTPTHKATPRAPSRK